MGVGGHVCESVCWCGVMCVCVCVCVCGGGGGGGSGKLVNTSIHQHTLDPMIQCIFLIELGLFKRNQNLFLEIYHHDPCELSEEIKPYWWLSGGHLENSSCYRF